MVVFDTYLHKSLYSSEVARPKASCKRSGVFTERYNKTNVLLGRIENELNSLFSAFHLADEGRLGAILIGVLHVFFYANYTILDELFKSCLFMQTVLSH